MPVEEATDPTRVEAEATRPESGSDARPDRSSYRWTICALLFAATTINYIDRQVLGILAPTLQDELGWSEVEYGNIVSWFSFAYGIGFLSLGRLVDRIGVKRGASLTMVVWSLAAMGHALAQAAFGFSAARAALGWGQGGHYPAAIKTVAEWFPRRERALATGLFNAGSNFGALIAPLLVPLITLLWGWRWSFVLTGAVGFVWLVFWLVSYRSPEDHPRVSRAELALIHSEPDEPSAEIGWLELLRHRQTWAFVLAKTLTDPMWWFLLFWLPKFLDARWDVELSGLAAPLVVVYLVAYAGSVGGGWLSGALIGRGWTVNRGRKITMLVAALLIVPTVYAPHTKSMWAAVAIISVAAAAHQWWSANLLTTASDMFPRHAIGSVVGIGGFASALGGVLFQRATGHLLEATGNDYQPIFLACGLAYVLALLGMHLLVPRMRIARVGLP